MLFAVKEMQLSKNIFKEHLKVGLSLIVQFEQSEPLRLWSCFSSTFSFSLFCV